ncbi:hypothetical protein DBR17_19050 [Sphingomonas sp. HMWF008]|nr:hypothetical protein DBR17_19050 [Sphingomonas sp. HMWF008]
MVPGQPAERALLSHDADNLSPCLDSQQIVFDNKQVGFQPRVLRGPVGAAMARKLLLRHPNPPAPDADAKPWFYAALAKMQPGEYRDNQSLAVQEFGHCVAVARWNESLALIKSDDGSPEEKAAVDGLIPALSGCLANGTQIKITRRNLRNIIGEPVYHLLLAATPSGEKA